MKIHFAAMDDDGAFVEACGISAPKGPWLTSQIDEVDCKRCLALLSAATAPPKEQP